MVIDVDEEELFEAAQPGALKAVALEQDSRVVGAVDAQAGANGFCAGKIAEVGGDAIGSDKINALAHLLEQHSHGKDAAYGVAVRTGVGADEKPFSLAQDLKDRLNWVRRRLRTLDAAGRTGAGGTSIFRYSTGAFCRFRERSMSSSMRAWNLPERSARKLSSGTCRTPMRSFNS